MSESPVELARIRDDYYDLPVMSHSWGFTDNRVFKIYLQSSGKFGVLTTAALAQHSISSVDEGNVAAVHGQPLLAAGRSCAWFALTQLLS